MKYKSPEFVNAEDEIDDSNNLKGKKEVLSPADEVGRVIKKPKISPENSSTREMISNPTLKATKTGDSLWELTGKKRITVSEFKGKKLIHIREYYEQGMFT